MSDKLLEYDRRYGRRQLVEEVLGAIHESNVSFRTVDKFSDGRGGYEKRRPQDICPFTVFASINTLEAGTDDQKALAGSYRQLFGINAKVPEDFDGVPQYPRNNPWWFSFAYERKSDDIEKLWRVFSLALDPTVGYGKEYGDEFRSAFDEAANVKMVGHRLPSGLYWIRPQIFLPLDGFSRNFLRQKLGMRISEYRKVSAAEYLSIRDQVLDGIESRRTPFNSFRDFSQRAWFYGKGRREPPVVFPSGISSSTSPTPDGVVVHRPFDPTLSGSGDPDDGVPIRVTGSPGVSERNLPRDREAEKIAHDLLLSESGSHEVVRYGHMTSESKDRGDGQLPDADFTLLEPVSAKPIKFVEVKSSQGSLPRSVQLTAWELKRARRCAREGIPYEIWIIVFESDNTYRRFIWHFNETALGLTIDKLVGVDVGVGEPDLNLSSQRVPDEPKLVLR